MTEFLWSPGETLRICVADVMLEIGCWGPPPADAPTLVLLHEGLGCNALWRDFPKRLACATNFGVLCYSREGYGNSDKVSLPRPLDYMRREAVNTLPAVLKIAAIKNFILLGHSDGASIAAIYTGSVSHLAQRGLILMAPHFFTEPSGLQAIAQTSESYFSGTLREKLAHYHRNVDNAFVGWCEAWLHPDFEHWDITEELAHWRIPVLGIQGADDQYGTIAQLNVMQGLSSAPVDISLLADCRHSPHIEQPEITLGLIVDYLRRLKL